MTCSGLISHVAGGAAAPPATMEVAQATVPGQPAAREKAQACGACHGPDGNSRTAGIPSIAAQPRTFLETQLILFREGVRPSPIMQAIARELTDQEIAFISQHFAAAAAVAEAGGANADVARRGRDIAAKLQCGTCHLPDYRGRDQIPRIAGQREDYLADSMIAFRDNRRVGGDPVMSAVLHGVSDADIRAMAHFLARER